MAGLVEEGAGGCSAPRGRSHSQTLSSRLWSPDSCFKSPEMIERIMSKSYSKESRAHTETVWIGSCSSRVVENLSYTSYSFKKKHAKY